MIKEYLNQPYPFRFIKWKTIILISVFVGLFMLVFQPFGLSEIQNHWRLMIETGYGAVTFLVLFFNQFLIQTRISSRKWTVLKQMFWLMWILFGIGLGNFIYSSFFLSFSNVFLAFLIFQFYTLVVGIIPIVVITILNQNALLSQNLKLAGEYNRQLGSQHHADSVEKPVCIVADNGRDKLEMASSDLIYIASTGNYIQVFYLKDNKLQSTLLRNTLKQTEDQLSDCECVIKCHRAFLVNMNKIEQVKGNSQGLRLALEGTDEEIPVSRSFAKEFRQIISN